MRRRRGRSDHAAVGVGRRGPAPAPGAPHGRRHPQPGFRFTGSPAAQPSAQHGRRGAGSGHPRRIRGVRHPVARSRVDPPGAATRPRGAQRRRRRLPRPARARRGRLPGLPSAPRPELALAQVRRLAGVLLSLQRGRLRTGGGAGPAGLAWRRFAAGATERRRQPPRTRLARRPVRSCGRAGAWWYGGGRRRQRRPW